MKINESHLKGTCALEVYKHIYGLNKFVLVIKSPSNLPYSPPLITWLAGAYPSSCSMKTVPTCGHALERLTLKE